MGDDRPVFASDELLDLELAVADDPERDRLDAPGRARAGQLSPQDRGEGEADQVVERAAGPVGVDQRIVDLARMAHRLLDRVLGDGVEHHAVDSLVLQKLLVLENLVHVPGDRLALAIRVGRQDDPVRVLDRAADLAQPFGRLRANLPAHGEIVVRIDRAVLLDEVAHMAERGVNAVVLAQILVDGLRLGGQLDDHDFHSLVLRRRAPEPRRGFYSAAGYGEAEAACQIGAAAWNGGAGRAIRSETIIRRRSIGRKKPCRLRGRWRAAGRFRPEAAAVVPPASERFYRMDWRTVERDRKA